MFAFENRWTFINFNTVHTLLRKRSERVGFRPMTQTWSSSSVSFFFLTKRRRSDFSNVEKRRILLANKKQLRKNLKKFFKKASSLKPCWKKCAKKVIQDFYDKKKVYTFAAKCQIMIFFSSFKKLNTNNHTSIPFSFFLNFFFTFLNFFLK